MLKPLRAVGRPFAKWIGWNRVGVALSITIIAVAAGPGAPAGAVINPTNGLFTCGRCE